MTPSMMSQISSKVDEIISPRNDLSTIVSQEPTSSPGGYSYQKHRSLLDEAKRNKKFLAGYDDARIARSKYF
jgi:hypothetical protein